MKIFIYSFMLFIVSFISASSITLVNEITKPVIEQKKEDRINYAVDNIIKLEYPSMKDDFIVYDTEEFKNYPNLVSLFLIELDDDEKIYVYNANSTGKAGIIDFLIIFNQDLYIDKIIYLSHNETPGRGDKIEGVEFLSGIINHSIDDYSVDTIAGATLSSNAVIRGLNDARDHIKEVFLNE